MWCSGSGAFPCSELVRTHPAVGRQTLKPLLRVSVSHKSSCGKLCPLLMPSKGFSRLDAFILTDCTFHQRGFSVAPSLSRSWRKQKAPETERKREYASILIKRARQTFCPLLCGECKLCRGYHFLYHRLKFIYLDGKNNRSSVRGAHKFQSHFIIHF